MLLAISRTLVAQRRLKKAESKLSPEVLDERPVPDETV